MSCDNCGKKSGSLFHCAKCHIFLYCNRKCQVEHYIKHKLGCDILSKNKAWEFASEICQRELMNIDFHEMVGTIVNDNLEKMIEYHCEISENYQIANVSVVQIDDFIRNYIDEKEFSEYKSKLLEPIRNVQNKRILIAVKLIFSPENWQYEFVYVDVGK